MRNISLFALALIASAATITPTVAAAEPVTVTSIVPTADLDLSSEAGRRQLDLRIVHAARLVCGEASTADLAGHNAARQCRTHTIAQAASQREQLIAAARGGTPILVATAR
jgi:UrcA family protein